MWIAEDEQCQEFAVPLGVVDCERFLLLTSRREISCFGMLVQDVSAIKMDTGLCCFKNLGIREPTAGSNWELLACCDMELFSRGHENRGQILRLERKETKYICIYIYNDP